MSLSTENGGRIRFIFNTSWIIKKHEQIKHVLILLFFVLISHFSQLITLKANVVYDILLKNKGMKIM